jgi:hypothetical protein
MLCVNVGISGLSGERLVSRGNKGLSGFLAMDGEAGALTLRKKSLRASRNGNTTACFEHYAVSISSCLLKMYINL